MERFTLREAAERTARSVTTLRRYIRSGRLHAEKRGGRYGPEYFVSTQDLSDAGLEGRAPVPDEPAPPARAAPAWAIARRDRDTLPAGLYQELQMKHEQLLVQYGMVRAGGLRAVELQAEVEAKRREVQQCREEIARVREQLGRENALLRERLRESELEGEGRAVEIAALREKVRALEMLTRNAVTSETIERQFADVLHQMRVVGSLSEPVSRESRPPAPRGTSDRAVDPDH